MSLYNIGGKIKNVGILKGEMIVVKRILVCIYFNSQVHGRYSIFFRYVQR